MAVDSIEATDATGPIVSQQTEPEKGSTLPVGWLILAVGLFLALGFALFRSTGQDDSYISYWPAHALAHYGRIVNYNGEAVEQSSSMLWVLMLGALAFVTHAPVPLLGPLLSIAGGVLSIFVVARLAGRIGSNVTPYAVLLTGTATFFVYWAFSGMEASFVGVCTAWVALVYADYLAGKRDRKIEIAGATLCCLLVRPEMGFVLCTLLAGLMGVLWLRRRRGHLELDLFKVILGRIAFLALLVIGLSVAVAAARMGYFHSPVPEPVRVKGGRHSHLGEGFTYLYSNLLRPAILPAACLTLAGVVMALLDALNPRKLNFVRLVCMMMVLAYCAFIDWVGGDWMVAGRFLVHILPVAFVLAADALSSFTSREQVRSIGLAIVLIQGATAVMATDSLSVGTSLQSAPPAVAPAVMSSLSWFDQTNRLFLRDAPVADTLDQIVVRLHNTGHPVAHLFTGQAGIVMYRLAERHFGHMDVTDRHGLADQRFATCGLAKGRPRLTNGLAVEYSWFLAHEQALESGCRIPTPDILYDIDSGKDQKRALAVQHSGYALVYYQVCDVPQNREWPHGSPVMLHEFIGVRRELLPQLGMHELVVKAKAEATVPPVIEPVIEQGNQGQ